VTLIIFAKCKDGFIIISDRKESEYGQGNHIQKYFLSNNEEFFLALSGDGQLAKTLFSTLDEKNTIKSNKVISEIQDSVKSIYAEFQQARKVEGFLIIKNGKFKLYHAEITRDKLITTTNDSPFFMRGDPEAQIIAGHLLKNINLESLPSNLACKHLIATMRSVAESVNVVGTLEKFGFDITLFLDSGTILQRKRYTDTDGEIIKIDFKLDSSKPIFSNQQKVGNGQNG